MKPVTLKIPRGHHPELHLSGRLPAPRRGWATCWSPPSVSASPRCSTPPDGWTTSTPPPPATWPTPAAPATSTAAIPGTASAWAQGLYDIHGAGMGSAPLRDGGQHRRPHEHPVRGHQRHRAHRDAVPVPLLHAGPQPRRQRLRPVPRRPRQLPHLLDLRLPGLQRGLQALRRRGPGGLRPVRRLSHRQERAALHGGTRAWSCWTGSSRASTRTGPACATGPGARWSIPTGFRSEVALPEGSLLIDYVAGGGGFGDPLERDPALVLRDFGRGWLTPKIGEEVYGVVLAEDGRSVDEAATKSLRERIRAERKQLGEPPLGEDLDAGPGAGGGVRIWCCASTRAWRSPPAATAGTPSAASNAATSTAAPRRTTRTTRAAPHPGPERLHGRRVAVRRALHRRVPRVQLSGLPGAVAGGPVLPPPWAAIRSCGTRASTCDARVAGVAPGLDGFTANGRGQES